MSSFGLGQSSSSTASAAGQSSSSLSPSVVVDASTPWMACAEGNLALLQHSLQLLHLDVSAQDEHGYALVHAAASYNQIETLKWLFSQGNANNTIGVAVDEEGDGLLHYASTLAVVQYCVEEAHIPLTTKNQEGKTALQAKRDELEELLLAQDDPDSMQDEDDEEVETLKAIIQYLESKSSSSESAQEGWMQE